MIAAMLQFVAGHKRQLGLGACIVALFGAGVLVGRFSVRQPAIREEIASRAQAGSNEKVDQTVHAGPEKITITDYAGEPIAWAPPVVGSGVPKTSSGDEPFTGFCRPVVVPGEDRIIRQTVIERGPSVTETHSATEEHREQQTELKLSITPAALSWSIAAGVEDPFGSKRAHFELGHQITDHIGIRAGFTPANGLVHGWTAMGEFRF